MDSSSGGSTYLIFLGAILTFVATSLVEMLKNWLATRNRRKRYSTYARLQLTSVLKVLNKLKYSYENNSRYLPRDIRLLEKALEPLNNMRNDSTTLSNNSTQEDLIDIIADLNLYIADINNLDDLDPFFQVPGAPAPDDKPPRTPAAKEESTAPNFESQWLEKNIELVDLRRRIEELIKSL
jgi:hypothetical protein